MVDWTICLVLNSTRSHYMYYCEKIEYYSETYTEQALLKKTTKKWL